MCNFVLGRELTERGPVGASVLGHIYAVVITWRGGVRHDGWALCEWTVGEMMPYFVLCEKLWLDMRKIDKSLGRVSPFSALLLEEGLDGRESKGDF